MEHCSEQSTIKLTISKTEVSLCKEHREGPILPNINGTQYKQLNLNNFFFKSEGDNCCALKNGEIIQIQNFLQNSNGIFVIGNKFRLKHDLYKKTVQVFKFWNFPS